MSLILLCSLDALFVAAYSCIFGLGCYNCHKFLYQQERYKYQYFTLTFYIFVQLACIFRIAAYVTSFIANLHLQQQNFNSLEREEKLTVGFVLSGALLLVLYGVT
jgi:hypothetical protein